MTLTDTGPLVAILDRSDPSHTRCTRILPNLSKPLITTMPVLTEGMHFLGRQFGWSGQEPLWQLLKSRALEIAPVEGELLARLPELMAKYQDTPMDLADASLVAVAEARGLPRIFTLDSHFYAFRLRNGRALQVLPRPGR
jgi:uncharacterized protein